VSGPGWRARAPCPALAQLCGVTCADVQAPQYAETPRPSPPVSCPDPGRAAGDRRSRRDAPLRVLWSNGAASGPRFRSHAGRPLRLFREVRRRESAVVCQQPPVVGSTQFGGRRRSRPRGSARLSEPWHSSDAVWRGRAIAFTGRSRGDPGGAGPDGLLRTGWHRVVARLRLVEAKVRIRLKHECRWVGRWQPRRLLHACRSHDASRATSTNNCIAGSWHSFPHEANAVSFERGFRFRRSRAPCRVGRPRRSCSVACVRADVPLVLGIDRPVAVDLHVELAETLAEPGERAFRQRRPIVHQPPEDDRPVRVEVVLIEASAVRRRRIAPPSPRAWRSSSP
jgi:hypothetical protein